MSSIECIDKGLEMLQISPAYNMPVEMLLEIFQNSPLVNLPPGMVLEIFQYLSNKEVFTK
jgi:hypothetical protein